MIVRALSPDHDWTFGKGRNDYLRGQRAVAQCIDTRVLSFLSDCFFDVNAGIDWFNLLGQKDQLALRLALSTVILNTPDVNGIVEVSALLGQDRDMLIEYRVTTVYSGVNGTPDILSGSVRLLLDENGDFITTENGRRLGLG